MSNEFEGPIGGSLQRHVDELLDQAPPTKGGEAEFSATKDGAGVEVAGSFGKGWSGAAAASWFKKQGWGFAAKVKKAWGGS